MSFTGFMFRQLAGKGDAKRDANLKEPADVTAEKNITRGKLGPNLRYLHLERGQKKDSRLSWSVHGGGTSMGCKGSNKF